jgi:hypothetical protein
MATSAALSQLKDIASNRLLLLRSSRHEGYRNLFGPYEAVQSIAGKQFNLDVTLLLGQSVITGTAPIRRLLKHKTCDDVLAAETIQLKVHDARELEGHNRMLVQHDVASRINFISHDPAMDL